MMSATSTLSTCCLVMRPFLLCGLSGSLFLNSVMCGRAWFASVWVIWLVAKWSPVGVLAVRYVVGCSIRRVAGRGCRNVRGVGRRLRYRTAMARWAVAPPSVWRLGNNRRVPGTASCCPLLLRADSGRRLLTAIRRQSSCCRRGRIPGRTVGRILCSSPVVRSASSQVLAQLAGQLDGGVGE